MINLSKKELKIIGMKFNRSANRFINCNYDDAKVLLSRFVYDIEASPLIYDYINDCIRDSRLEIDIENHVKEVVESYGRETGELPSTVQGEVAFVFNLLKFFSENPSGYQSYAMAYSHERNFQKMIDVFHKRVIFPFAMDIENYINMISIEMGYDEDVKYNITVNGGQLNLAKDSATIIANQNNGEDISKLKELIDEVVKNIPKELPIEDSEAVNDYIETIKEEILKDSPKKGLIRTSINGLKSILPGVKGSVEFIAAVTALIQFVAPYIN